jgi:hypothetical protein
LRFTAKRFEKVDNRWLVVVRVGKTVLSRSVCPSDSLQSSGVSIACGFSHRLRCPHHPKLRSSDVGYYVSALYVGQLSEGQRYSRLRPAVSICVLSRAMFTTPPALHLDFRLREVSTNLVLADDLQIHILQQVEQGTFYFDR